MVQARATSGQDPVENADAPAGSPYPDFTTAAEAVLQLLRHRVRLRLWMVTRAVGRDQVVLQAQNASRGRYGASAGMVLPWDGSLCAAMVAGHGPMVAPSAADVPAYASASARKQSPIEAYVGVPLRHPDGRVFGTLCGFDPQPQPEILADVEDLVVLQAALLSTVLALELDRESLERRVERAEVDANRDALTGLANRRAWENIVAAEEARSGRYGHPGCVLVLDLNDLKSVNDTHGHVAGDDLLRRCAEVLTGVARSSDFVARLGGDEFGVLAVETDRAGGEAQVHRLREALADARIEAAVGFSVRAPGTSFEAAYQGADQAMYRDKERRRAV
jgi:diguanylate cyclase (GGDEF)-like protein